MPSRDAQPRVPWKNGLGTTRELAGERLPETFVISPQVRFAVDGLSVDFEPVVTPDPEVLVKIPAARARDREPDSQRRCGVISATAGAGM